MNFDGPTLIASLFFSFVGFFYLKHGKRVNDLKFAIFGMLLIIYGYFTPNVWWTVGIGVALAAMPFVPLGRS